MQQSEVEAAILLAKKVSRKELTFDSAVSLMKHSSLKSAQVAGRLGSKPRLSQSCYEKLASGQISTLNLRW